ncbi:MAG: N-formylglutamate amidohydrolase [Alphaproteobacteria bacterium]|nr:N-formylglutamate amidohydrolase [Alphaproteobacteria bacterium]MCB9791589.1 N-formylglutamate amidohydrolase [Alphaproteobacteria bacterium]
MPTDLTPPPRPAELLDAVELIGLDDDPGPLVLTCEHASKRIPQPLVASAQDAHWLDTHWGWDIGAAEVTRELARLSASPAVLTRVSRLVSDANRDPSDPTWVREVLAEGGVEHTLDFNRGLDEAERARRVALYHAPYHACVDALVAQRLLAGRRVLLLSVHSFTPVFDRVARPMEIGVLYVDHEPLAERYAAALSAEGFATALNAPYSGRDGLMYAAHRHGTSHDVVYLELELRQDLLLSVPACHSVASKLHAALGAVGVR